MAKKRVNAPKTTPARILRCWEQGNWDTEIIKVPAKLGCWECVEQYVHDEVATQACYHKCSYGPYLIGWGEEVLEGMDDDEKQDYL
jgi:hypothetical protein